MESIHRKLHFHRMIVFSFFRSRLQVAGPALALAMAPFAATAAEGPPPGTTPILMPGKPGVSADGGWIYFEWARDLWRAGSSGGRAERLTSHPALDQAPHPVGDGGALAFTSFRDGARQLFSMPADGGVAVQHTFHSEGVVLEDVTPCGDRALVRVLRDHGGYVPFRLAEVALGGSRPERILFNEKGHSAKFEPGGERVLFCRDGERIHRKGYRGERATSIWLYDQQGGTFECLIKEAASARDPLWHPSGAGFYYVSERDGTFNLWRRELADEAEDEQLTFFEGDGVQFPALSADGGTLVFRRGFQVWTWRPDEGGEATPLDLWHSLDLPDQTAELLPIRGTSDADFSPSGLEIVFAAEGRVWVMDTVLREPRAITAENVHASGPRFSVDGKRIHYLADDGMGRGLRRIERRDPTTFWWKAVDLIEMPLTGPDTEVKEFAHSPDGMHIAYVAMPGNLVVMHAERPGERRTLFEWWDCAELRWSPAGEWLAFSSRDNDFSRNVYVVPFDGSAAAFNVSQHPSNDFGPAWSPDGRKLAFVSSRSGSQNRAHFVYLRLDDLLRNPRSIRTAEAEAAMKRDPLYQIDNSREPEPTVPNPEPRPAAQADPDPGDPAADDGADDGDERKADDAASPPLPDDEQADPVAGDAAEEPPARSEPIDFEGLADRIRVLDSRGQTPTRLIWSHDSKALLFQTTSADDENLYRVELGQGARPSAVATLRGLPIRMENDGTLFWLVDNTPARLRDNRSTRYTISVDTVRDRKEHLRLGFRGIWRTVRDEFYDAALNGTDWEAVGDRYETVAVAAPDSDAFREAVLMMLGELNASHLGFVADTWPPRWRDATSSLRQTRHPGIRFEADEDGWRVDHVLPRGPASLADPPILPGDRLLRVDGVAVSADAPLDSALNGRAGASLVLTIRHGDGSEHQHNVEPITWAEARALARTAELLEKRQRVQALSDGRLGYIHIASMVAADLEEFQRLLFTAGHGRDGLVIDVRDNTGGFISDELLKILIPPQHAVTIPRHGGPGYPQYRTSQASWGRPIVVLCDQNTYSNGEVFAHAVKTLGRGQVVGRPTPGAVISTINRPIFDLGSLRLPFRGWFLPGSGEDFEMHGAVPDHLVNADPADLVRGVDRQLEKAVEVLLEECDALRKLPPFEPRYRNR